MRKRLVTIGIRMQLMELFALAAIILIVIYAFLTGFASYQQFKLRQIQPWSALGMFASALALFGAGYFLGERSALTLPLLIAAILSLHGLAVVNGLHMHRKINWSHHLARGILSLALIGFTVLGLGF